MKSIVAKIGDKYGRLTVIGQATSDRRKRSRFECHCNCGAELIVLANALRTGNTKSCGCLKTESSRNNVLKHWMLPPGEAARRSLLASYKHGAKKRHLAFVLNEEQFKEIITTHCFYCSTAPAQITHTTGVNGQFTYNGIDRVDNSKGYTPKNSVACCRRCNWAKGTLSRADFLHQARRIIEYQRGIRSYSTGNTTDLDL